MKKRKSTFLLTLFLLNCLYGCNSDKDSEIHEVKDVTSPTYSTEALYETTTPTEVIIIESEPEHDETETTYETEMTEPVVQESEMTEPVVQEEPQKSKIELTIDEIAFLTIGGKYGYGDERRENITNLGYDYSIISKRVDELLAGASYYIPDRNTYYFNFGYVNEKVDVYDADGNREGSLSAFQKFLISDEHVDGMTLVYFKDQTFYLKDKHIHRIGDSHLEMDISEQKVYFYLEGNLILEADIISGDPNKGTILGTNLGFTEVLRISYNVTFEGGKQSDIFILFNWDGEGFHDAGWREDWEFDDKDRYLTHGSNGCCNMRDNDVNVIEENTYMGMHVLIHK